MPVKDSMTIRVEMSERKCGPRRNRYEMREITVVPCPTRQHCRHGVGPMQFRQMTLFRQLFVKHSFHIDPQGQLIFPRPTLSQNPKATANRLSCDCQTKKKLEFGYLLASMNA